MTGILFTLLLACLSTLPPASAQKSETSTSPAASSISASLDHYLAASADLGRFSGAVLVAKDGGVVFRKAYGYADVEKRASFTVDTQLEIASLSKMFTAVAILKLRDQGKLHLEDSVCADLRDCPDAWKPITIEELLRHTSGIPDYEDALDLGSEKYLAFMREPDTSSRILENAKKLPLDFAPGSKFKYSNTGYVVLSFIAQQISGRLFGEFLTDQVLKPAGMLHTGIFGYGTPPTLLARGYTHGDVGWPQMLKGIPLTEENLTTFPALPLTPPHGDAGMFSTVDDLNRWSLAMDGGGVVSASEIAEIFSPGRDSYGYGWTIGEDYGEKRYQHAGILPGSVSMLIKFPVAKLTIVILSNLDRTRMGTISEAVSAIALGKPFDMPVTGTVVKLTKDQQAALAGAYKLDDGRLVTVAADGDSLSAESKGHFLAGLIPLSATTFYMPLSDGTVTFTLDASGKAKSINLHYKGTDHTGPLGPG